jgi:hypothetical protein
MNDAVGLWTGMSLNFGISKSAALVLRFEMKYSATQELARILAFDSSIVDIFKS